MTVVWFDAQAGASGDMLLAALVDAGAPLEAVQAAVDSLGVEPIRLHSSRVTRGGLAATKVDVEVAPSAASRTWREIRSLLAGAALTPAVRDKALDVFARLSRAEGAAHGVAPDDVHFHEVGALDSLADVVGVCAALEALQVSEVLASPVTLGHGSVSTAHGVLPVPVPAVLAVLAEAGAPVQAGEVAGEACTPTGAALLAATVSGWGSLPAMRVSVTGHGAGHRDPQGRANVVRVVLGERTDELRDLVAAPAGGRPGDADAGGTVVLEANVDDLDPRVWPHVLNRLLDAGASDAWLTPILMKKGRPAHTLCVLVAADLVPAVQDVVFTETTTIGLRVTRVGKLALPREERIVSVAGVDVRVKVARLGEEVVNVSAEYADALAAATALGRPLKTVLAAAVAAGHDLGRS